MQCVVIGGGIAGLATAGLLARDGHQVTLLDKGTELGGRAGRWSAGGFTFDTGPSWYLMPQVIDHWFALMGSSAAAELDLVALDPAYRLFSGEGDAPLDVRTGRVEASGLFESLDPGSGKRLERYLDSASDTYEMAKQHFLYDEFANFKGLLNGPVLARLPKLARLLLTSLDTFVARSFGNLRQRQILGYPAVFLGTTPFKAPAMYHLMSHLDLTEGVAYPQGGFAALIDSMERLVRAEGVDIKLGATATQIISGPVPGGARAEAVAWTDAQGESHRSAARIVVGAADLHHIETRLLPEPLREHPASAWAKTDPGPSAVLVCLGVRGALDMLTHHNLFFTSDWRDNFTRIDTGSELAAETSIYVCAPSTTDTSVSPAGDSNLFILVPSPAAPQWGHGGLDGQGSEMVERVADAAIDQLAAWAGITDLRDRITLRRTVGPADFVDDVNAFRGSALGPAHTLRQSAFFRPGIRNHKLEGLFYAGSSVRPGIGVPMCMISAELVLKAVRGDTRSGPVEVGSSLAAKAGK
ncbi:phytoene desaturase family protein [Paeniglutamicibacter cryotolerans]|uniref:Phytoene desaturase n=1 Tax=Paeniglutamicibacter cryotolerans TaxID=670079 RepID=A0A839QN20_9MICC|nr:phytoene desaturase family protein [Paeniglutamicibacter cryotolerans]MBB2994612.1 phytoene desaturase [Paeniglutamicibacter cryotolerans]